MAVSKRKGIDPITEHHYENLKFGKNKGKKTVFTLQVEHPKLNKGKPTLIPSIWDGKELSEDAAIKKAIDSKIKWTSADDHKELRKYDMLLHDPKKMNMDLDNTGDQKSFAEGGYNKDDGIISENYPDDKQYIDVSQAQKDFLTIESNRALLNGNTEEPLVLPGQEPFDDRDPFRVSIDDRVKDKLDDAYIRSVLSEVQQRRNQENYVTGSIEGQGSTNTIPIETPEGFVDLNSQQLSLAATAGLIIPTNSGWVFNPGANLTGSASQTSLFGKTNNNVAFNTKFNINVLKEIADGRIGVNVGHDPETGESSGFFRLTKNFNTGGTTMQNQMSMFEDGGMMDQGGTQDPVSGNAVPVGSLQEEVRDDVDAKLSPGEYVVPADVVRYFGLDFFMQLRDKAKTGLARMEDIGQMGNSESTTNPTDTLFSQNEDMDVPFSKDDLEIYKEDNDEDETLSAQVGAYVPAKQAPQTNTLDSYLARVGDKPAMYDGGLVDTSLRNRGISFPTGSVKRFVDTTDAKRSDLFITVDVNGNPTTQVPSGYAPADSFPSSSSSDDPFKGDISTLGATELDRPSGPDDNKIEAFNYAPPNEGGDLTQEQWDTYFAGKSAGERAETALDMMVKGIPGQGGGFSQLADALGPVIPPMTLAGGAIQLLSGKGLFGKAADVIIRDKKENYRVDPETGEPYADKRIEPAGAPDARFPGYSVETPTYAPDIPSPKEQRGDSYNQDMDATSIDDIPTIDFDFPDYMDDMTDFDYEPVVGESLDSDPFKTGGFIKRKYAPGGLVDTSLANRRTSLVDKSLSEKGINTASNPKDTSVESEPPAQQSFLDPSTTPYKNTGLTYTQRYGPKLIARSSQTNQITDHSLRHILGKYVDGEDFEHVLDSYASPGGYTPAMGDHSEELKKELDDLFGQRLSIVRPINTKTNPDYFSSMGRPLPGFTAEEFKEKYGPDITIGDAYRKMLSKEYSVFDDMSTGGGELPNQFGSLEPFLNLVMRKGEKGDNVIKTLTQKYINRTIDPNKKIETAQDASDVAKLIYFIGSGGNAFPAPGEGEPFSVWSKMPRWNKTLTAYKNANLIPQPLLKTANVGAFVTKPSKKKTSVKKRGLASKK